MSRRLAAVLVACLVLPTPTLAADPPAAKVDEVFAAWDRPDSPGLAVAVVRDGEVVYKKGFGSANLEHRVAISPTTAFNVGSVSKQFTAFAILLLVEEGKLSLDDPVRKHVPEVPDFGKPITIRHLLHHTSGLREDWSLLAMSGTRPEDVIRTPDLLRLVSRQKELNFEPGAEYLYCNTGYDLLGVVVGRVSGLSLAGYSRDRVFLPAKMGSTEFHDNYRMLIPNRAASYRPLRFGRGFEHVHFATERAGPSNLFTTAEDLARWFVYQEELVKTHPKLAAATLARGKLNDGKQLNYAAGLQHRTYRGAKLIHHNGTTAGYKAALQRYPDHRFAVAILGNLATIDPGDLAHRVADLYLEDKLGPKPEVKKKDAPKAGRPALPDPKPEELGALTGKFYSEELEVLYAVAVRDGRLVVCHPKGELTVRPVAPDEFDTAGRSEPVFDTIRFTRNAAGAVTGFKLGTARARNVRFAKVELKPAG